VTATVGTVEAMPPGTARALEVNGLRIAVFNLDGDYVAVDGRCRHRGGPLEEGYVSDGVVMCPWHWWRYDLRTGRRLDDPSVLLARYPVSVVDGYVRVDVPPPLPVESIRDRLLRLARQEAPAASEPIDGGPSVADR
jgi:nitrite reductase (NADH) small subunit/3-phenylpropionate/trans-cinnamate dioxygenase ferredoxin subunit